MTDTPAADRPSDAGASGSGGRDDEPGPDVGRALADAQSNLARTLEQLGGGAGAPFAELAKAHQKSMGALLEYDRVQEELLRSLKSGTAVPAEQVDRLLKLAEAHRKLMKSKVEYDETLSGLVRTLGTKGTSTAPAAEPTLTRGGADDAKAGAR